MVFPPGDDRDNGADDNPVRGRSQIRLFPGARYFALTGISTGTGRGLRGSMSSRMAVW